MDPFASIENLALSTAERLIEELKIWLKYNPEIFINIMQSLRGHATTSDALTWIERELPELDDYPLEMEKVYGLAEILTSDYVYQDIATGKAIKINNTIEFYERIRGLFLDKCDKLNIPLEAWPLPYKHWRVSNEEEEEEEDVEIEFTELDEMKKLEFEEEARAKNEDYIEKSINELSLNQI